MNVSPPVSGSQWVLMNVLSLEYRVVTIRFYGVTTFPTLTILPFLFSRKISKCLVCKMFEVFENVNFLNCVLMNFSISCCLYFTLIYRGVCVCVFL